MAWYNNFNHPTMGQPTSHTSLCGISPGHSSRLLEPSRFQCIPFRDTSAPPPPKRRSYPLWDTPSRSARNRRCGLAPASSPPACPLRDLGFLPSQACLFGFSLLSQKIRREVGLAPDYLLVGGLPRRLTRRWGSPTGGMNCRALFGTVCTGPGNVFTAA